MILPIGYSLEHNQVDLASIFNEEGYNPFLTEMELRDIFYEMRAIESEYESAAWEHYLLSNAMQGYLDSFICGRSDSELLYRYHQLARLLIWLEQDYTIDRRKLVLNNIARKELKSENKQLVREYSQALTAAGSALYQAKLF